MLSACAGIPASEPAPTLADTVLPVLSAQESIDSVWTGFWPENRAFLVYERDGDALLYSPIAPPAPYAAYQPPVPGDVPALFLERLYRHAGVPDGLHGMFNTAYRVGDTTATAVPLDESASGTLEKLFHETFHAYQDRHFEGDEPGFDFIEPDTITPSIIAKAEIERRILREALAEGRELRESVLEFLAVRDSRRGEMSQEAREAEQVVERTEGSAELVGIEATAAALGRTREYVSGRVRRRLAVPLAEFPGGLPERLFRWRMYDTGAAIGLVLDRLGMKSWRKRLEEGETFEGLLAKATGFEAVGRPELLSRRALERFDYDRLLRREFPREIADPLAAFEVGPRIVVTFPASAADVRSSFSGTPSALEEKLLFIDASLYTAELADFALVARDVDVLFDSRNTLRLTFSVDMLPVIANVPLGDEPAVVDRLDIGTSELTIEADRPVRITAAPASLLIQVLPYDASQAHPARSIAPAQPQPKSKVLPGRRFFLRR